MEKIVSKLPFFSDCAGWPKRLLPALNFLIDEGEEIERDEFLAAADVEEAAPDWGWHIQYFRHGDGVYWYVHSAIFAGPGPEGAG